MWQGHKYKYFRVDDFVRRGTEEKHSGGNVIPPGLDFCREGFILQQYSDPEHNAKLCYFYLKTRHQGCVEYDYSTVTYLNPIKHLSWHLNRESQAFSNITNSNTCIVMYFFVLQTSNYVDFNVL